MPDVPIVKLDRLIQNATALTDDGDATALPQQGLEQMQNQKAQLDELCSNFKNIVETLAAMQSELFRRHKEDIINLAVEIARKILGHKIEQGDYQIHEVIKNALGDATIQKDIVIRLNPKDYAQIEQLTKASQMDFAKGATFVADAGIGQAQCLIETPKGIVESLIDEHLERISQALKKAG